MTKEEDEHKDIEKKYKEFVLYFRELDAIGIPYGMSDLKRKAEELGLPIPSREEIDIRIDIEKWIKCCCLKENDIGSNPINRIGTADTLFERFRTYIPSPFGPIHDLWRLQYKNTI